MKIRVYGERILRVFHNANHYILHKLIEIAAFGPSMLEKIIINKNDDDFSLLKRKNDV